MGQQTSVVDTYDSESFLPWKDAAVACLPERAEFLETAGISKNDLPSKTSPSRVDTTTKQAANKAMGESCACWDNVFYVLSSGRGTKDGLPEECIPALVAILSGGKASTRWLCEAAMMALARLYADTKDEVIANRITDLWECHEISNVRDLALLVLRIIGAKEQIMYCEAMKGIDKITDDHDVWRFCPDSKLKPEKKIDWTSFDNLLSAQNPMRSRVFALFRLKNTPAKELGEEWKQVFSNVVEIVLSNVVDDRLVLQAALSAVSKHKAEFDKHPRLKEDMILATENIASMCVYREGRNAAKAVLKDDFKDPFTSVFDLFPAKPTLDRQALQKSISAKFEKEFRALRESPEKVYEDQYSEDFEKCWNEAIKNKTAKLGYATTKVYDIVMLYYLALYIPSVGKEMKLRDLQMLIASSNLYERYIGLVHIGIAGLSKYSGMVQYVVDNESISDVRGCAEKVLEKIVDNVEKKADWGDLMKAEREALVSDFPEITGARSQDAVVAYLKGFGL